MPKVSAKRAAHLYKLKKALVEKQGCLECTAGQVPEGFEQFWNDPVPYNPRSYTLDGDLANGPCNVHCRRCNARRHFQR